MNVKPPPSNAEIRDLAKRLKPLWASGQSVRPFLRKHAGMIRTLQSQGWSWAGLALAFNKAKITYRTDKPWTADTLMQAFSRAQVPLQQHGFGAADESRKHDKNPTNLIKVEETGRILDAPRLAVETPSASAANVPSPVPDELARATSASFPSVPQFKPFSLKPQELPPDLSPGEIEERAALHRRMFGS
jgi:hypothetical protein